MPCELFGTHLQAYLDGELDAAGAANFESHLQSCPQCFEALAAQNALRQSLAGAQLYERAPDHLRRRVRSQISPIDPASLRRSTAWRWAAVAAGILLALILSREVFSFLRGRSEDAVLVAAAVDAHLRSLQPGHLTDVQSTDQHTVKPWFDGKVDLAPSVRDFAAQGFPLIGGRLDVLDGRTVAVVIYARRKHIVNVFVMNRPSARSLEGSGERQGYHWLAWQAGTFQYLAVSDVAPADLRELRNLFLKE